MTGLLTQATWLALALLVIALVLYLVGVLIALWRAGTHLAGVEAHLSQVARDTEPLEGKVGTINTALGQLHQGLGAVDRELAGIVRLFGP